MCSFLQSGLLYFLLLGYASRCLPNLCGLFGLLWTSALGNPSELQFRGWHCFLLFCFVLCVNDVQCGGLLLVWP